MGKGPTVALCGYSPFCFRSMSSSPKTPLAVQIGVGFWRVFHLMEIKTFQLRETALFERVHFAVFRGVVSVWSDLKWRSYPAAIFNLKSAAKLGHLGCLTLYDAVSANMRTGCGLQKEVEPLCSSVVFATNWHGVSEIPEKNRQFSWVRRMKVRI